MAEVRLSGPLRIYTENKESLFLEGKTVWDIICQLVEIYPELEVKLIRNGALSMQTIISVDRKDIRLLENENTGIKTDSIIHLLPSLVGG